MYLAFFVHFLLEYQQFQVKSCLFVFLKEGPHPPEWVKPFRASVFFWKNARIFVGILQVIVEKFGPVIPKNLEFPEI